MQRLLETTGSFFRFAFLLLLSVLLGCTHRDPLKSNLISPKKDPPTTSSPANSPPSPKISQDYASTVGAALCQETDALIADLKLPAEQVSREKRVWLAPPWIAKRFMKVGTVRAGNYEFSAARSNRICFVDHISPGGQFAGYETLKVSATWPISKLDTNAAVTTALNWLQRARADTAALKQDTTTRVYWWRIPGDAHFIPLYRVYFDKTEDQSLAALVVFFQPGNSLHSLRIKDAKYNLRAPIKLPD